MKHILVLALLLATTASAHALNLRAAYEALWQPAKATKTTVTRTVTITEKHTIPPVDAGDGVYRVTGQGATPENAQSKAQARLMAVRAAEMDAHRKLAELLAGVDITATSATKDYVQESYRVTERTQALLRGAHVKETRFSPDGIAEVDVELVLEQAHRAEYGDTTGYRIRPAMRSFYQERETTPSAKTAPTPLREAPTAVMNETEERPREKMSRAQTPKKLAAPKPREHAPEVITQEPSAPAPEVNAQPDREPSRQKETPTPKESAVANVDETFIEPDPAEEVLPSRAKVATAKPQPQKEPIVAGGLEDGDTIFESETAATPAPFEVAKRDIDDANDAGEIMILDPGEAAPSGVTDLVIDARGLGAKSARRAKIYLDTGARVYPFEDSVLTKPGVLPRGTGEKSPTLVYVNNQSQLEDMLETNSRPLYIRATGLRGRSDHDLVLQHLTIEQLKMLQNSRLMSGEGIIAVMID